MWDANIRICVEVKRGLYGGETCRWHRTWIELRCTSPGLDVFEIGPGWS